MLAKAPREMIRYDFMMKKDCMYKEVNAGTRFLSQSSSI